MIFQELTRKNINDHIIQIKKKKSLTSADIKIISQNGTFAIVKDFRDAPFPVRTLLGPWLLRREYRIYKKLQGIEGVPRLYGLLDKYALVIEYIDAVPIHHRIDENSLPSDFCSKLKKLIEKIHSRGVVHLDLKQRKNILVTKQDKPYIIDFASAFFLGGASPLSKFVFPILKKIDLLGFLKWKALIDPESMTREEKLYYRKMQRLRCLWIFS